MSDEYLCIAPDVKLGDDVKLSKFINLYGCEIGDNTKIGAFVEIQKNASIGKNCKISSHTFICEGVTIEDNVFIGHGVTFINDSYPRATVGTGSCRPKQTGKWSARVVKKRRLDRFRVHHPFQCGDRRKRHRRRRQRGDERRARKHDRCGKSRPKYCVNSTESHRTA